jgi:adenylyltransferase/sulfurtransferase
MNVQTAFTNEELTRYSRHLILPDFGKKAQLKLKNSKVLVIGTGGLGAPLLQYLTAAGVGTIGVVDFDVVDLSNLQRQVLFTVDDVGKPKVDAVVARLSCLNPNVNFEIHNVILSSENALDIIGQYDVVADGTDNFPTRYLVNDACVLLDKPLVYGSIFRFDGQVSVFNYKNGPDYRDLFPTPPPPGLVPNCAEGGVIGVLPGIIGSLQANEAIKILAEIGETLSGRLFIIDTLTFESRILKIRKQENASPIAELIDYDEFCGIQTETHKNTMVKEITVQELNEMRSSGEDHQLIDVREPNEYAFCNIGGELIPVGQIVDRADEISKDKKVVMQCRSGMRSANAIVALQDHGFDNLYNLKGGILAWSDEIDSSVPKY